MNIGQLCNVTTTDYLILIFINELINRNVLPRVKRVINTLYLESQLHLNNVMLCSQHACLDGKRHMNILNGLVARIQDNLKPRYINATLFLARKENMNHDSYLNVDEGLTLDFVKLVQVGESL